MKCLKILQSKGESSENEPTNFLAPMREMYCTLKFDCICWSFPTIIYRDSFPVSYILLNWSRFGPLICWKTQWLPIFKPVDSLFKACWYFSDANKKLNTLQKKKSHSTINPLMRFPFLFHAGPTLEVLNFISPQHIVQVIVPVVFSKLCIYVCDGRTDNAFTFYLVVFALLKWHLYWFFPFHRVAYRNKPFLCCFIINPVKQEVSLKQNTVNLLFQSLIKCTQIKMFDSFIFTWRCQ